ncbi:hypothetical protein [Xenorhabdus thailandensis]
MKRKVQKYFNKIKEKIYKLSFLSLLSTIGGGLIVRIGLFILPYYVS